VGHEKRQWRNACVSFDASRFHATAMSGCLTESHAYTGEPDNHRQYTRTRECCIQFAIHCRRHSQLRIRRDVFKRRCVHEHGGNLHDDERHGHLHGEV
jgi:hypothetical protein